MCSSNYTTWNIYASNFYELSSTIAISHVMKMAAWKSEKLLMERRVGQVGGCRLRGGDERVSASPGSAWLGRPSRRWTARPRCGPCGTGRGTRPACRGCAPGCRRWAAAYWGWRQTPAQRPARRFRFANTTHLEDVERLELDAAARLAQHVHHQLQVVRVADVARHDGEVVSVEQQLAQQLQRAARSTAHYSARKASPSATADAWRSWKSWASFGTTWKTGHSSVPETRRTSPCAWLSAPEPAQLHTCGRQ